jgi:hypothetical protein
VLSPEARLDVYRHNVESNHVGALSQIYPVVHKIVGDDFFRTLVTHYVRAHPSPSGDLNQFGKELSHFITGFTHTRELPYLSAVAALEWARHKSFHAADALPIASTELEKLGALGAEELGSVQIATSASMRLISAPHPVKAIWEMNVAEDAGDNDWQSEHDWLIVFRTGAPEFAVHMERLSDAEWHFWQQASQGASLAESLNAAITCDNNFDLQATLIWGVQTGVITGFLFPQTSTTR